MTTLFIWITCRLHIIILKVQIWYTTLSWNSFSGDGVLWWQPLHSCFKLKSLASFPAVGEAAGYESSVAIYQLQDWNSLLDFTVREWESAVDCFQKLGKYIVQANLITGILLGVFQLVRLSRKYCDDRNVIWSLEQTGIWLWMVPPSLWIEPNTWPSSQLLTATAGTRNSGFTNDCVTFLCACFTVTRGKI